MNINIDTQYSIGDKVFVLYSDYVNNDYYCTNTRWYILKDSYTILAIKIIQDKKEHEIEYLINNCYYCEDDLFLTQEEAEVKCYLRNNKNECNCFGHGNVKIARCKKCSKKNKLIYQECIGYGKEVDD